MNIYAHSRQQMLVACWVMCFLLLEVRSVDSATLTVTNLADSGPGTLRDTIAAANTDDLIEFGPELSGQTITLSSGQLMVTNNLSLDANSLNEPVVVSGGTNSRILMIATSSVVLIRNLVMQDGRAVDGISGSQGTSGASGGGVFNRGTLTLSKCIIRNCRTGDGGDSTNSLSTGSGGRGGAVYNSGTGILLVVNSLLIGNTTGDGGDNTSGGRPGEGGEGGGLFNATGGVAKFQGTTVVSNRTGKGGIRSTFISGGGGDGAGLINYGSLYVTNSLFFGNETGAGGFGDVPGPSGRGAGMYLIGNTHINHTTITGNYGVGILRFGNATTVTLENAIVAGNPDNLVAVIDAFIGSNLTNGNPLLAPLGDYGGPTPTMPPLPGSPAIDAAVLSPETPSLDQRGAPRPNGLLPDIGAVEAFAFSSLTIVDTDNDGIDDRLEPAYGLVVGNDDSAVDSDGDGYTDASEIFSMTNPLDANDHLRILDIAPSATFDPSTNPLVSVTFAAFPGLGYAWETGAALTNFQTMSNGQFTATNSFHVQELLLGPDQDFLRVRRANP